MLNCLDPKKMFWVCIFDATFFYKDIPYYFDVVLRKRFSFWAEIIKICTNISCFFLLLILSNADYFLLLLRLHYNYYYLLYFPHDQNRIKITKFLNCCLLFPLHFHYDWVVITDFLIISYCYWYCYYCY